MKKEMEQPSTLEEAIAILKKFYKDIEEIKAMSEKDFIGSSHFFSGMFIRNSWLLWWYEGHGYKEWPADRPKIVEWFNSIDIVHADDMSSIILTCLHRDLNGVPFDLDAQVERYKKHWREAGYADGIPKMGKEE